MGSLKANHKVDTGDHMNVSDLVTKLENQTITWTVTQCQYSHRSIFWTITQVQSQEYILDSHTKQITKYLVLLLTIVHSVRFDLLDIRWRYDLDDIRWRYDLDIRWRYDLDIRWRYDLGL